ncbi:MAG: glycosyltransferase family 2 protein [Nitrososphaerales archaeon]|jgi:dolichol-phosphate mannosyltransferase
MPETAESVHSARRSKVGLVIPVYGESETIGPILSRVPSNQVDTVCVVVDVPLKTTMQQLRKAAEALGITVHIIKNRDRRGVGYCLRQGLEYLMSTGHAIAVIMAGNGKDDPTEIHQLIGPVLHEHYAYVQGSRYVKGGSWEKMPFVRMVFNRLYPVLWTIVTGRRCTDVTNGYRCYRLDILRDHRVNLDQKWLNGYSLEYYLHYKVLLLGYRMKEVPVSKIYAFRHKGGYSKIQPLKDWWPILSPLVLLFLGVRN